MGYAKYIGFGSQPPFECVMDPNAFNIVTWAQDGTMHWVRDSQGVYHVRYLATLRFAAFGLPAFGTPSIDDPGATYRGTEQVRLNIQLTIPDGTGDGEPFYSFSTPIEVHSPNGSTQTMFVETSFLRVGSDLLVGSDAQCA